jgi:cytochrome c nitrite reductase small subunit
LIRETDRDVTKTPRGFSLWRSIPFTAWIVFFLIFGGIVGLATFTFTYAQGTSYLSDNPSACANCHIMRQVYNDWNHGSHKAVAGCNDCHTPHTSVVAKYAVKAINGWNHSLAFTLGGFHEPIRITTMNRDVALHNCISCHASVTADINHAESTKPTDCLLCHSHVGHEQ